MRFAHKTEAEITAAGLWPAGEYDFEVKDAAEKESKTGNDMIELQVNVFDAEGNRTTIFDYLVHTEKAAYKVRHFAEATGMLTQYESDEMNAHDCVYKSGRCKIIIKKDKDGQYPDKNAISDYVKAAETAQRSSAAPARSRQPAPVGADDLDDSIPF